MSNRYVSCNAKKAFRAKDWLDDQKNWGRYLTKRLAEHVPVSLSTAHKYIQSHHDYCRDKARA